MEVARPEYTLRQLTFYFLKLGYSGFGGPVALVGYMHRDLVENRKWISDEEYKEGLALAQLAPGPLAEQLSMYLGFVHFRFIGATLVSLAFVIPSFLMVVAIGIAYKLFGGLTWMQAVFYGVGAAVIGALVGAVVIIGIRSIVDIPTVLIAFTSVLVLLFLKKVKEPYIILIAGILGLLLKTFLL